MEIDAEIKKYSETVYEILCHNIGNDETIYLNRLIGEFLSKKFDNMNKEVPDFSGIRPSSNVPDNLQSVFKNFLFVLESMPDSLKNNIFSHESKPTYYFSGSRAEGFDFITSDYDIMQDSKSFLAVQRHANKKRELQLNTFWILWVDTDNTIPGFARLKSDFDPMCAHFLFERQGGKYYLSSTVFKFFSLVNVENCEIHGPCVASPGGHIDFANVIPSHTWPLAALGCIHRMLKCKWPPHNVIREMVNDGCLFVPIGSKSSPHEDIEWRMSFSIAEKRLVYSMNHTQFLTYALLKLLLKDVIEQNAQVKDLLCSYFMKTLVFWEIMQTKIPWKPQYLLQHVWHCFRRLLGWINIEYCPNFFVPENNMFMGKICGRNRRKLLSFLGCLYTQGHLIFNDIPLIGHELNRNKMDQMQRIEQGVTRSKAIQKLLHAYCWCQICPFEITSDEMFDVLQSSKIKAISEFSNYLRLSKLNVVLFKQLCLLIVNKEGNKSFLKEKDLFRLIRASSPDSVRSKLFIAIYLYRCCRYEMCISLLRDVVLKLANGEIIYTWAFNPDKYSSFGGDILSVSNGLYRHTSSLVPLDSLTCIPEIAEECNVRSFHTEYHLIHPGVLAHVLLALCQFWTGEIQHSRIHLMEVQHCIEDNKGSRLPWQTDALSWQILGICQEIIGDFRRALASFRNAKSFLNEEIFTHRNLLDVNNRRRRRITSLLKTESDI